MKTDENKSGGDTTFDIVIVSTLDASVDEVWRAWRDPDYVMRWWGPIGFTAPLARMDFREGGSSLVCMRAPKEYGGQDIYNTWTYSRIIARERIEFVSNFANERGNHISPSEAGVPPGVPFDVPHEITFEDADGGKTRMTVTEYDYQTEEARDMSHVGQEQCIDKMAAMFAG